MSDRPTHLIIVNGPDDGTLELFSAHHTKSDAQITYDRLSRFTKVHMIEVPETDGVTAAPVKETKAVASEPFAPVKPDQVAVTAQPPIITRAMTAEEFAEETRQLMENGANGVMRDADAPLSDGGAFS
jgi:23S rRNA pseudoU1915 N3-methylase RlmH